MRHQPWQKLPNTKFHLCDDLQHNFASLVHAQHVLSCGYRQNCLLFHPCDKRGGLELQDGQAEGDGQHNDLHIVGVGRRRGDEGRAGDDRELPAALQGPDVRDALQVGNDQDHPGDLQEADNDVLDPHLHL